MNLMRRNVMMKGERRVSRNNSRYPRNKEMRKKEMNWMIG